MKSLRFLLALFAFALPLQAEENLGEFVVGHLVDAKYWYLTPWGPKIYFPSWEIFGVTVSLSLHVAMILLSAVLLLALLIPTARGYSGLSPSGRVGHLVESFVVFIRDEVVVPNVGKDDARKWMPFFLTIFFFFLTLNLLGLIPGFGTATSNINFTATFAILVFVLFNLTGMRRNGFFHYFANLIPKGLPLWLLPLMAVIEFVGLFTKAFALALRLFANLTAGHALIFSLLGLIIVFKSHFAALPLLPFTLFIYLIEILVGFLQAYIFTLLASLFIGQAVHQEH